MLQIHQSQLDFTKEFNKLKNNLLKILGNKTIEHIGSTALKNVDGKGIIDILVGASDEVEMNKIQAKLIKSGYFSKSTDKHSDYIFLSSTPAETTLGDHHIHLTIKDSKKFIEYIKLRDYFINNPDKAKEYSDLKHRLIKTTQNNRKDYKKLKSDYIEKILSDINS